MNKTLLALTATAALALASNVAADSKRNEHHGHGYQGRARVVDVQPVYRIVRVAYPEKHCRYLEEPDGNHRSNYVAPGELLLGGLIGGVIGHELGKNHNPRAAAVTGAVLGTAVAHAAHTRHERVDYRAPPRRHCRVETHYRSEKQFKGYRVTYRYQGELYTTHRHEHPGKWIRVDEDRHHRH